MATLTNQNGTTSVDNLTYNKAGTYYAYAGSDTIKITGGSGIVVYTDSGNNIINVTGGSSHTVKTTTDNAKSDTITGADKLTVNGANLVSGYLGSGKDEITLLNTEGKTSSGALSQIHGGAWGDTFTIGNGAKGYQLYGDAGDDIFNINSGSNIVCWGGAANDTFNVTGGTGIKLRGGDSADKYNVSVDGVDMQLGYGNDVVNVTAGNKQTIKANLGINTINLKAGSSHVITSDIDQAASKKQGYTDAQIKAGQGIGYGVDKVFLDGTATYVTAHLGDGKDEVNVSRGYGHKIYTEGWGDTINISGTASNSTFDAGAGDDSINISGGTANTIAAGEGNDKVKVTGGAVAAINLGKGNDEVTISAGEVTALHTTSGKNTITISGKANIDTINFGNQYDEVKVMGGKLNTTANSNNGQVKYVQEGGQVGSLITGAKYDNISIKGGEIELISTGDGDDDIWYTGGTVGTIRAGLGDDTIYVTTGAECEIYGNEGDDIILVTTPKGENSHHYIMGGAGQDEISVSGMGHLVSAGVDNDTVTLLDGAEKITVLLEEGNDKAISKADSNISEVEIYGGDGKDTIELKGYTGNTHIYGDGGNDIISVGYSALRTSGQFNQLNGNDGDDNITCINNRYVLVAGGAGKDTITCQDITYGVIYGGAAAAYNDKEYGGISGADTIYVNHVSNSFINGAGSGINKAAGDGANAIYLSGSCTKNVIFGGHANSEIELKGDADYNYIRGGNGNDKISISNSSAAYNEIYGRYGDDTYTVSGGTNNYIYDTSGKDTFNISGGAYNTFVGADGNDTYNVGATADYNLLHHSNTGVDRFNLNCNAKVLINAYGSSAKAVINIVGATASQVSITKESGGTGDILIKLNNIYIYGKTSLMEFYFGAANGDTLGTKVSFDNLNYKTGSLASDWNNYYSKMADPGSAVNYEDLQADLSKAFDNVAWDLYQIHQA